ncbi:SDR family NAD(P)-dependent oxidoreductase, partial [Salinimicrobium oceani]
RKEALQELKTKLEEKTAVHTLQFDVRDKEAVQSAIESLPQDFSQIDVLVNNAGNAHGLDPIQKGSLEDWDAMIDINVKGLLYVSRAIIPQMLERRSGDIVNIGSLAGKEVYPNGNVYSASKHAVDAINKGMRIDLNGTGIRVGAINPGLVETNFSEIRFKGDSERASSVYKGYEPLKPEDIADLVVFMVTRPAHVNIADLLVLPTAQANSTIVHKE